MTELEPHYEDMIDAVKEIVDADSLGRFRQVVVIVETETSDDFAVTTYSFTADGEFVPYWTVEALAREGAATVRESLSV